MFPCTLGAFRTPHQISRAFTTLVDAVWQDNKPHEAFFLLDYARSQSQGFARRDAYDLRHFAEKILEVAGGKPALGQAARDLIAAYDEARIAYCALGPTVTDSSGLAFYFPSSRHQLRRDIKTYERLTFSQATGWAKLLEKFR